MVEKIPPESGPERRPDAAGRAAFVMDVVLGLLAILFVGCIVLLLGCTERTADVVNP